MSSTQSVTCHLLPNQDDLFTPSDLPDPKYYPKLQKAKQYRTFIAPAPELLRYGNVSLKQYLKKGNKKVAFQIRELLKEQDWSAFEANYASDGRAPYAPMPMMGLILYGLSLGKRSLRDLEDLAFSNLHCQWITGGICPSHSVIGDFFNRHSKVIEGDFFNQLTGSILKLLDCSNDYVAGDGTVIEAACSHYNLVKKEAAQQMREKAEEACADDPGNEKKQKKVRHLLNLQATLDERIGAKKAQGKRTDKVCISPTEPDAVMLKQKRGRGSASAYKPSVLANEIRLILGFEVHPCNETVVVPKMLDQYKAITGVEPSKLSLDAGYFTDQIISLTTQRNIDLLCVAGKAKNGTKEGKHYGKGKFEYDPQSNSYRCPAGEQLIVKTIGYKGTDNERVVYATDACSTCKIKSKCTPYEARTINRYKGDDAKEAQLLKMQDEESKKLYGQRQAMVEPVFSIMRDKQNLNRFKRRGLAGVNLEFAIHSAAHNVGRYLATLKNKLYYLQITLNFAVLAYISVILAWIVYILGIIHNLEKSTVQKFFHQKSLIH